MTEYIKKDNVLNLDISMYISEGLSPTEAANMAIKNFKEFVKEIAPSDVVERKCGKWLPYEFGDERWHKCSACDTAERYGDEYVDFYGEKHLFFQVRNYCPNCGSQMESEGE